MKVKYNMKNKIYNVVRFPVKLAVGCMFFVFAMVCCAMLASAETILFMFRLPVEVALCATPDELHRKLHNSYELTCSFFKSGCNCTRDILRK